MCFTLFCSALLCSSPLTVCPVAVDPFPPLSPLHWHPHGQKMRVSKIQRLSILEAILLRYLSSCFQTTSQHIALHHVPIKTLDATYHIEVQHITFCSCPSIFHSPYVSSFLFPTSCLSPPFHSLSISSLL